ncbi:SDR family oxidoreductase [Kibdelosporangium philippinense]|uniref:SDR family oxidoreductase n=1 Tax=Kibdelosporangium philippinense TaxID=211113 RepID=A0ABS8ZP11_9PSEU|nr:SDR family oxidoreductase [Kibdelosporangium philippinense]MCE7009479.1 SDR family oxidoreductase [Kibdelosporangium philippinense]
METSQRVALVTGGARGIGEGIVRRLAADGLSVGFTYLQAKDRADALAQETGALAIHADSGDEAAVRAAVNTVASTYGGLDVLVNNAFSNALWPIRQYPMEFFDTMLRVNLRGTWVATQEAAAYLGEGGRIINIGSIFADHLPAGELLRAGQAVYAMVKAGMAGMTRGLARELGPKGITANTIQPGIILSDSAKAVPDAVAYMVGMTPVGKVGQLADVASVVSYLASLESRFVNGATWDVDGGFAA